MRGGFFTTELALATLVEVDVVLTVVLRCRGLPAPADGSGNDEPRTGVGELGLCGSLVTSQLLLVTKLAPLPEATDRPAWPDPDVEPVGAVLAVVVDGEVAVKFGKDFTGPYGI